MALHIQSSSLDQHVSVDVRGPGEWIVAGPTGERSLHVYRLAPADWLVSVVGRDSEGRGKNLKQALAVLSSGFSSAAWWDLAAELIDAGEQP